MAVELGRRDDPDAADMLRMDMGADHAVGRLARDPAEGFDDWLGELGGPYMYPALRWFEPGVLAGQAGIEGHGPVRILPFAVAALRRSSWVRSVSQTFPALAMAAMLSRPRTVAFGVTIWAAPP